MIKHSFFFNILFFTKIINSLFFIIWKIILSIFLFIENMLTKVYLYFIRFFIKYKLSENYKIECIKNYLLRSNSHWSRKNVVRQNGFARYLQRTLIKQIVFVWVIFFNNKNKLFNQCANLRILSNSLQH